MTLKHQPMGRFDWERIIARAELPMATKTVAMFLAMHANMDGSGAHPGERRLADILDKTERYMRDQIDLLRDLGLVERTAYGRKDEYFDTYQLTVPGPADIPMRMRLDPNGRRYTPRPEPKKRPRKPKDDADATGIGLPVVAEDEDAATGSPFPEEGGSETGASGSGLPEDDLWCPVDNPDNRKPGSGSEPVDNPGYRNQISGSGPVDNPDGSRATGNPLPSYRKPGSDLPEAGFRQGDHYQPLTTTGSPHATNSLAELIKVVEELDAEITDDEFNAAREQLAALPDLGLAFQARAEAEIAAFGRPDPSMRLVIVRAAHIANQSPNGA